MMKRIFHYFLLLSRQKQLIVVVWTIHFFALLGLIANHFWTRSPPKNQPIVVRTFSPTIEKKISAPLAKVSSASVKQKPSTKPAAAKPTPKPPAKQQKNSELLKQVSSALAELKTLEKKKERSSFDVPDKISLESKKQTSSFEHSYSQTLIAYLENSLDLPEYGKVKLELCIDRTGRLVKSEVLTSENEKNSEFLKNRLPELTFPCFNDVHMTENTLTFTVSFRNAETF